MRITKETLKALIKEELSKSPLQFEEIKELKIGDKIAILIKTKEEILKKIEKTPAPATVLEYSGGWLSFYWDSNQISSKKQMMHVQKSDLDQGTTQLFLIKKAR